MVNPRDIAGKRRKRRTVKRHWDGESRRQVRGERVNEIEEGGLLNVYVVADWRVHLFPLDEWLLSSIRQQQGVVEQG